MEPLFCDLCDQSVPEPELAAGRARRQAGRLVCERCLEGLGTPSDGLSGLFVTNRPGGALPSPPPALPPLPRSRRGSGVLALVLSCCALLFAVAASTLLLVVQDRQLAATREREELLARDLQALRTRTLGLERLLERRVVEQVDSLRADLRHGVHRALEDALAAVESDSAGGERTAGDPMPAGRARVAEPEGAGPARAIQPASGQAQDDESSAAAELEELEARLAWLEDQLSDLRLRRDLPAERTPVATGIPRVPQGSSGAERAAVLARLGSEDPALRAGALFALAAEGDRAAIRDVLPLLEDPHPYVRETAARLLERLDARAAVQHLIAALEDENVHVREAAATAVRAITGRTFAYDPRADSIARATGVSAWRAWWRDSWRTFLYGETRSEGG